MVPRVSTRWASSSESGPCEQGRLRVRDFGGGTGHVGETDRVQAWVFGAGGLVLGQAYGVITGMEIRTCP